MVSVSIRNMFEMGVCIRGNKLRYVWTRWLVGLRQSSHKLLSNYLLHSETTKKKKKKQPFSVSFSGMLHINLCNPLLKDWLLSCSLWSFAYTPLSLSLSLSLSLYENVLTWLRHVHCYHTPGLFSLHNL
jgi:hypothetical protein